MKKRVVGFLSLVGILVVLLLSNNKQLVSRFLGELKYRTAALQSGTIMVPETRTLDWKSASDFANQVHQIVADKPLPKTGLKGRSDAARILLSKLVLKEDIAEVNQTLMKLAVWGNCGSSWPLNKDGNYDFTLILLTIIYGQFGDQPELIYPETKDYLFNVLLSEDGSRFSYTVPRTFGFVQETENHMLMTEGSRYLKNQWLRKQWYCELQYDNLKNGMEHKLLTFLKEMRTAGLDEFNSLPYSGYTITALLAIETFASERVSAEARNVLDYMNWCYALGSCQLKHYPPMRRRYSKAGIQELTTDYHSEFMKAWLRFSSIVDYDTDVSHAEVHAAMGAIMPYRPADEGVEMLFNKGDGYFVKVGHGPEACPEIYSAGKQYLLSAGGSVSIVVFSKEDQGVVAIFEGLDPIGSMEAVVNENADSDRLYRSFRLPGERTLGYDVRSPKEKWVMVSDDGQALDRDFDHWALIDGDFENEIDYRH